VLEIWRWSRFVGRGVSALFHGPPGTGKTLAAGVLARVAGRPLLRVDLSQIVSKSIGEIERNLARSFERAEGEGAILLFDEADALFGKRSDVRDAHDRYANLEAGSLLQRIEAHRGLVILTTNHASHIEAAFLRRLDSIIEFPRPTEDERRRLFEQRVPAEIRPADDFDFGALARSCALTGAAIDRVMRTALLATASRGDGRLAAADLRAAIQRETERAEEAD